MASISFNKETGKRTLYIVCPDGKRRPIPLDKVSKKQAEEIKEKIEALDIAKRTNTLPDKLVRDWVSGLPPTVYDKISRVGLLEPRVDLGEASLATFLDAYIASRKDAKSNTKKNLINTRNKLVSFFGANRQLARITDGDCDDWRQDLVNQEYSSSTISKAVKHAKRFFRHAMRKKLISSNPFQDLVAGGEVNRDRLHFVERETFQKLLDGCPDNQWRCLLGLCRYGAFRNTSETLSLRWADINWADNRITITSPKTERHQKGERIIPLFPELRPHLEKAFEEAEEGAEFVITKYRDTNANLRTALLRILRRLSIPKWERIFQNLRASRIIELADCYPAHIVKDWCGNSELIAERHYLMTTEEYSNEHWKLVRQLVRQATKLNKTLPNPEIVKNIAKHSVL